uniref:Uncharacterized protein n=1 Tax=Plectus sambesii TaxID=2011161 RepID=A0A914VYK9_9BILA
MAIFLLDRRGYSATQTSSSSVRVAHLRTLQHRERVETQCHQLTTTILTQTDDRLVFLRRFIPLAHAARSSSVHHRRRRRHHPSTLIETDRIARESGLNVDERNGIGLAVSSAIG